MEQQIYIDKKDFRKNDYESFVIVGDIGSEHSYLAIMGVLSSKSYSVIFQRMFFTKDLAEVHTILNECLAYAYNEYSIAVDTAVLAAAGPISRKRGYIKLTNIDFEVNAQKIYTHTMMRKVILLNDFEAIGYGLDNLDMGKDVMLIEHFGEDFTIPKDLSSTFAVIGAGNGLGMTMAYFDKTKHIHVPLPSEGGHMNFAPQSALELELLQYLRDYVLTRKHAHPELERVLCGKGLVNIYNFLRSKKLYEESKIVKEIDLLNGNEKLLAIESNPKDMTCQKTMELFILFYARAARNLALMSECYSGLFIVAGRMLDYNDYFRSGLFMQEFELHDQRTDVLRMIPVYLIKNKDVGLYGCCNVAVNFSNLM